MNQAPVNTALKASRYFEYAGRGELAETSFYENPRGVVFYHDMCAPMSEEAHGYCSRAECICTVLAWAHGYETFAARAGVLPAGNHTEYLEAVRGYVARRRIPTFIVCGKKDLQRLKPHASAPIKLLGTDVMLAIWNRDKVQTVTDAAELPGALATLYESVYDFSCGYGNTLRPFKYFIGSDIDRKCLNYIEREIMRPPPPPPSKAPPLQSVKEIKIVSIKQITPYHRNVRHNDRTVEQLVAIIPKVGFNVPLVLDRNNVIVKGHARWAAGIKLKMKALPCVYTDADEETIKLDRLADNKLHELTQWDDEQLQAEIASLTLGYDIDLEALGFAPASLEAFLPPADGTGADAAGFAPGEDSITPAEVAATVNTDAGKYEQCVCNKCGNVMFVKVA